MTEKLGDSFTAPVKDTWLERYRILQDAANLTCGPRNSKYGPPVINMAAAGALKAAFRKHMTRDISLAELEAIDMCLTKLGRIATGHAPIRDSYVDAAAYIGIAGQIALDDLSDM